jgi:hypothetical protein
MKRLYCLFLLSSLAGNTINFAKEITITNIKKYLDCLEQCNTERLFNRALIEAICKNGSQACTFLNNHRLHESKEAKKCTNKCYQAQENNTHA